jgi:DNA-directed RNA polymerase alpha subunit
MNNFYLSCKECVLDGPRNFYGCFYLGPFTNSQSLTIANALRRTLLSEISGLAIISVQIEGVEHEYSTFLGIRESVLDLLLNLKEIVLCFNSEPNLPGANSLQKIKSKNSSKPKFNHKTFEKYRSVCVSGVTRANTDLQGLKAFQTRARKNRKLFLNLEDKMNPKATSLQMTQTLKQFKKTEVYSGYLQATGPGIVRAADLKLPSFLKCVDSNQYIATLAENGKLNFKIQISKSSYSKKTFSFKKSSSKNFLNNSKVLKLDSIFTPIKKVNYKIQNYGALNMNSNNQVIQLELWTNGSVHPRTAVYKALNLLSSTFSKLEKMKILNDVYIKSILKSDLNYSKIIKKNLYNLNFTRKVLAKNMLIEFNQNLKTINSFDKLRLIYFDKKQKKLINEFIPIKILNLPFRIENCLIQQNILTINDFFLTKSSDLERINGLSRQSLIFLQKKLFLFLNNYLND